MKVMEITNEQKQVMLSGLLGDGYVSTHRISYIVQQIKGKSSRLLRSKFGWLRKRIPTLWTRSYFAESVGIINEETIKKYIENQKNV